MKSLDQLVETARSRGPVTLAVAAGHDPDVIEALKQARDIGLAEGIFVGNAEKIRALAESAGLQLSGDQLIDEPDAAAAARKAIALIRDGKARLLMKGKIATATLVRAVLDRERGLRGGGILSPSDRLPGSGIRSFDADDRRRHQHRSYPGPQGRDLPQRHSGRACHRH